MARQFISADEAAVILKVSRATAYRLVARGKLTKIPLEPTGFALDPQEVRALARTLRARVHRRPAERTREK